MAMKEFTSGERLFASDLNANFDETQLAANIISGTFDAARIPNLDASKITSGKIDQARLPMKKIARFTGNGTWTVPSGVTYAIAYMIGGGGGVGLDGTGGDGANSSVAFSTGTVTALGSNKNLGDGAFTRVSAGKANTGQTAGMVRNAAAAMGISLGSNYMVAGSSVTPGASVAVTVGAGGSAGTSGAAGGSGYVYIEYYE